ncbi:MAG: ThuA domain-containing protein [Planctomycetaceae bacterium]
MSRSYMKAMSAGFLILAVAGVAIAETPTRILFIGKEPDHPYGSHMYMHVGRVLAKCAELTPGVETVVSNGWPEDAAAIQGVNAIVVYTSPGAEFLLDSPHRAEFDKLMHSGAGLVTIHWASAIRQQNFDRLGAVWLTHTGGTWISRVGLSEGKSLLTQLIPEHPICRGWEEYEFEDEYYLYPTIEKAKPLLQVTDPKSGQEVYVGWVYERPGGGRTFSTTLGHPYANFQREPFRRMLVNAILWSAGEEVPEQGANVAVGEDVLALPPQD